MFKSAVLSGSLFAMILSGCASKPEERNTNRGVGLGAATGAVLGGVIGHQSGNRTKGAVLGAAAGGVLGGLAGRRMDKQAAELDKVAETKRTEEGLITKLNSDILFDTGKAALRPTAKENLKEMAEIMKKYPENVIQVNGFTDNTGSSRINEELSEKRAEVVKKTLVDYGLPEAAIATEGLGPARPVAPNTTAQGRAQNRRVEIQVSVDQSKVPATQTR